MHKGALESTDSISQQGSGLRLEGSFPQPAGKIRKFRQVYVYRASKANMFAARIYGVAKDKMKFDMDKLLRALADRTRLRLLNLIGNDEVCVCFFVEILGESQPKISRHLAYLRRAGIVGARREGKWIHYRIVDPPNPHAVRVLSEVRACLAEDKEMQRERGRLVSVFCAPDLPIKLQGAPRPSSYRSA